MSSEAIGGHAGIPRTTVTRPVTEVPFYPEEYASLRARRSREIPKSWLSGPRSSDVHSDPRGQSMPIQTEPTELHYEAQFNRKFGGRYTNLTDENTRAAFAWQQEVVAQARRTAEEAETPSWKTGLGKDNLADKAEPNRDIRHNPAHGNLDRGSLVPVDDSRKLAGQSKLPSRSFMALGVGGGRSIDF